MKKALKLIGAILLALLLLVIGFFGVLSAVEYRPDAVTELTANGNGSKALDADLFNTAGEDAPSKELTVLTWNIGYSGLGSSADFFMDGGKGVRTQTKEQVQQNLEAFASELETVNPDFVLLQEVDRNSTRSYHVNGADFLSSRMSDYQNTFANNFKVLFVPYPLPPIGAVDSGILPQS